MKRSATGQIVSTLLLGLALPALAQSGGGYDLSHNVIGRGGGTFSTAGSNTLNGTAGQDDAGPLNASPYTVLGGFWGVPSTSNCGNGAVEAGEQCDDGAANGTATSCCTATCQFASNGIGCDDGNGCTQTDQCDGGGHCVGSNPLVCIPLDQCHLAGECDPTSGCSNPAASDGTTCNAGNACAPQPDTCQLGTCIATKCVNAPVAPGGTVTTDTQGNGATPSEPVQTAVTSPDAGTVAITETAAVGTPPTGFTLVGAQVTVSAPGATPDAPLILVFLIDASRIPAGADQNAIQVFKDGVLVPACTGAPQIASPDPCVSDRQLLVGGDVQIAVLTSTASVWTFAVPICGDGVIETGELCDEGAANGTLASCCTATCQFQPGGTPCADDGNPCTADSCDSAGSCRHSATCQSNLIPGGGSAGTDCTHEWLTDPSPSPDRKGLPTKRLECTDDDPSCDFGATTGTCTFHVAMCFNATEQRFACTPSDVQQVRLTKPAVKPRDPVDAANRATLEDALAQLGGTVQGTCTRPRLRRGQPCAANSDCDSAPGKGDGTCPRTVNFSSLNAPYACTPFADITVPLGQTATGWRTRGKTLGLIATPSGGRRVQDRDSLTLVCKPKQ
jgi:hypothetical protein